MSASDKKQQRKAQQAEGMTQKERQEQAAANAAKRRKTIYWAIGIVCAVAAAALLIWNGMNRMSEAKKLSAEISAVAATVDGVDYTAGEMQYYYNAARQETLYMWQLFTYNEYSHPYNPYVSDGAQWYNESENKTYADYFREYAVTLLKNDVALCKAANAAGYTISDEGKETIEENLSQIDIYRLQSGGLTRDQYLSQMYGNGVTEKVYVKFLTNEILASEYEKYHQENISYDDAALQAFYEEQPNNYDSYDYRIFYVDGTAANPVDADGNPVKDADGNTVTASDEEKATALALAK